MNTNIDSQAKVLASMVVDQLLSERTRTQETFEQAKTDFYESRHDSEAEQLADAFLVEMSAVYCATLEAHQDALCCWRKNDFFGAVSAWNQYLHALALSAREAEVESAVAALVGSGLPVPTPMPTAEEAREYAEGACVLNP